MPGIRKRKNKLVIILACFVILSLALFITWKPILRQCAYFLDTSQSPTKSDAMIVLGGGTGAREEMGARLYRQGLAPNVIASGEEVLLPGIHSSFAQISADYLVVLGVPLDAITLFTTTTSTRDEAQQSLTLAKQKGWTSIIVVTDIYHSRRSWLTFRNIYCGSGV
jgi:uncharacterized SAM-binding protein YcdF (DUF218 family)